MVIILEAFYHENQASISNHYHFDAARMQLKFKSFGRIQRRV